MPVRRVVLCLALAGLVLSSAAVANTLAYAKTKYNEGSKYLSKGNFKQAYWSFNAAAKADPANQLYRQKAQQLRQVLKWQEALENAPNLRRWLEVAKPLCNFYYDYGFYQEALDLGQKIYAKQPSQEMATLLARTRLALGQNDAAVESLRKQAGKMAGTEVRILMGIALARQGQTQEAQKLLESTKLPKQAGGHLWFDLARFQCLMGHTDQALDTLRRAFENTPPTSLEALRNHARQCADFAALKNNPKFASVLNTASKVDLAAAKQGRTDTNRNPYKKLKGGKRVRP